MAPLLSVIVPIYGIEQYLGLCIESIINQTYKNLEIILVDDGSPDLCPQLCELYAAKDKRIKVLHKENGGLVSARKAGLAVARGDYVGYVDGDDWIEPDFFQSLYSAMSETHADVVVAGFSRDFFEKQLHVSNVIRSGVYEGNELREVFSHIMSFGAFFYYGLTSYVWNKLFRREDIISKQFAVDNFITVGEDSAVTYPFLWECKRICIIDNYEYHYRQRTNSMLKSKENFKTAAARLKTLHDYLMNVTRNYPNEYETDRQIRELILGMYVIIAGGKTDSLDPKLKTFPFSEDIRGRKIIAYGAGTFGQQFVKRIEEDNACEITAWVDDDYWGYRRYCINVDPVERVAKQDFDNILILNLNPLYIAEAKKQITSYGVDARKIVSISVSDEICRPALNEYLNAGSQREGLTF